MERRLALAACLGLFMLLASCGGDDDAGETPGTGVVGGPEPVLEGPASRYAPALEDLPGDYSVFPPETFALGQATWSQTGPFDPIEGQARVQEWEYEGGFQVQYRPDGLLAGVLEGRYYVDVETHLFATASGAESAFEAFERQLRNRPGAEILDTRRLANESVASSVVVGHVGTSDTAAIYHRFIFRRGNLVAVVQTYGGEPFMDVNLARDLAVLIDERALGQREAIEPTPIPATGQGGG